jgi:hypothetical protein
MRHAALGVFKSGRLRCSSLDAIFQGSDRSPCSVVLADTTAIVEGPVSGNEHRYHPGREDTDDPSIS